MDRIANRPLTRFEKGMLYFFLLGVMPMLGFMVEYRTAFLQRRMGDLDCFLRAAWAVRTGNDLYAVTSDNDWHYNYPPLYAILFVPLADPPPGADKAGFLPYSISAAICFLINVFCMFWSAHVLALVLEEKSPDSSFRTQAKYCQRWWVLRLWPIFICFLPIAHTMMRGQANLIVLAALCAALAGWMRQQNFRAGMWLAFAICIKVVPIYLLVYPLWKRDVRGLAGVGVGMLAGLVVVPLLAFGPTQTATHYQTYAKVFVGPILNVGGDESRKTELVGMNRTESVGVRNAIFNWMYPNENQRPDDMPAIGNAIYLLLGFLMTFLTLWPGTWSHSPAVERSAHPFAALILLMTIFGPVCHSHYLMFCLPIVMSLLASHWEFQGTVRLSWTLWISFVAFFMTMAIAYLPGMEILKDRCASLFATLPLWGIPIAQLWRGSTNEPAVAAPLETRAAA